MSQVILNVSGHHQVLNTYHLHPHKWLENPPSAADQIKSAVDENHQLNPQKLNSVRSPPLYLLLKQ